MLVFPRWTSEFSGEGCRARTLQWAPPERFAPYIARPVPVRPTPPIQVDEESSSSGSSPEWSGGETVVEQSETTLCGWRGCNIQCGSLARLSAHIARAHGYPHRDGLYYCQWSTCNRSHRGFNARYKMLVHVRTHTNEKPHTCNQCNKSFSRAENLKIHLRSHSGEKPYVCPFEGCGKAYSNSSDRFKHTRTHSVDKPYCCKVEGCNKRYTDPSSLRKHVKTYNHAIPKVVSKPECTEYPKSPETSPRVSPTVDQSTLYKNIDRNASIQIPPYQPFPSPSRQLASPTSTSFVPVSSAYSSSLDQIPYMPPTQSMPTYYQLRVPQYKMSHTEYAKMYEHTYRSYYTAPVLSKEYSHESIRNFAADVEMEAEVQIDVDVEELPLNLKCSKSDCTPIEDLVRRTDLPLDLSTKS